MQIELRFYNPDAGVDAAGVPCEVTHTEARAQMFADLLDAMAAQP